MTAIIINPYVEFITKYGFIGGYGLGGTNGIFPGACAVDSLGNFYISGTRSTNNSAVGIYIFLTKIDKNNNIVWHYTSSATPSGSYIVHQMVIDKNNNVYIIGQRAGITFISAFSASFSGTPLWQKTWNIANLNLNSPQSRNSITVDSTGTYVTAIAQNESTGTLYIGRFNASSGASIAQYNFPTSTAVNNPAGIVTSKYSGTLDQMYVSFAGASGTLISSISGTTTLIMNSSYFAYFFNVSANRTIPNHISVAPSTGEVITGGSYYNSTTTYGPIGTYGLQIGYTTPSGQTLTLPFDRKYGNNIAGKTIIPVASAITPVNSEVGGPYYIQVGNDLSFNCATIVVSSLAGTVLSNFKITGSDWYARTTTPYTPILTSVDVDKNFIYAAGYIQSTSAYQSTNAFFVKIPLTTIAVANYAYNNTISPGDAAFGTSSTSVTIAEGGDYSSQSIGLTYQAGGLTLTSTSQTLATLADTWSTYSYTTQKIVPFAY
jgi:hypothetical protein